MIQKKPKIFNCVDNQIYICKYMMYIMKHKMDFTKLKKIL